MLQQQPDRPSVIHIHPAVMCEHHILVRVEEEMLNEQEEQVGRQVQGQIEDEDVEQNEDGKGVKLHDRKMKQRHVEGEQRLRRALSSTDRCGCCRSIVHIAHTRHICDHRCIISINVSLSL